MPRTGLVLVALLAVVAVGLVSAPGVLTWTSDQSGSGMMGGQSGSGMMGGQSGSGMMGGQSGSGMMGGGFGLSGNGQRVDSLAAAGQRAQLFADRLGLRVGDVIQFDNGFHVDLLTFDGRGATEVTVDADDGAVAAFGPALLWNTRYGVNAGFAAVPATLSAADATAAAQQWLDRQGAGLLADRPQELPGYYTLRIVRDGRLAGMVSVHAATGAVWSHTWHGQSVPASGD